MFGSSLFAFLPLHTAQFVKSDQDLSLAGLVSCLSPSLTLGSTHLAESGFSLEPCHHSVCALGQAGHGPGSVPHSLPILSEEQEFFQHLLCASIMVGGGHIAVYKAKKTRSYILVNEEVKPRFLLMVISTLENNKAGKWDGG